METRAKARYIRMSPKKIRLVVDVIRGMKVSEARDQLRFLNKRATRPVEKLLNSAVANAVHNNELEEENLFIKEIRVDQGPILKRWRPRAFGRTTPIRRRSSHILIVLDEIVKGKKAKEKRRENDKKVKEEIPVVKTLDEVKEQKEDKKEQKKEAMEAVADQIVDSGLKEEKGKEIFDQRRRGKHRHKEHEEKRKTPKKGFVKRIFSRKSNT